MTGRVGKISQNSEIWVRCPFCGDSKRDPTKAHMTINPAKALYHCRKCNAGGRMTYSQLLKLLYDQNIALEDLSFFEPEASTDDLHVISEEDFPELEEGPGNSRDSLLHRYHLAHGQDIWDAFKIRDNDLETVGILLRRPGKSIILGSNSGLLWYGDYSLRSTPEDPLYIVEGPYDVLRKRDVCISGMISSETMTRLRGHSLVLTPDGDVWTDQSLFFRIAKSIEKIMRNGEIYLAGLEVIPDGKDPDEVPPTRRILIERYEIQKFINQLRGVYGIHDNRRTSWKRKVLRISATNQEI